MSRDRLGNADSTPCRSTRALEAVLGDTGTIFGGRPSPGITEEENNHNRDCAA